MKAKRLLFLVMAIYLASGVKAQFYDGPEDIYYYVCEYNEYEEYQLTSMTSGYYTGRTIRNKHEGNNAKALIFNFDGTKAALLCYFNATSVSEVKQALAKTPSYYEDKVETTEYKLKYEPSSSGVTYKLPNYYEFTFSSDRNTLKEVWKDSDGHLKTWSYKRVDKSFFRVGRSRKPSGTLYE